MAPELIKIDWVSPLPPVRTGIAEYSVDLLPYLAEVCDLRVVQLPGQALDRELARQWNPVTWDRLGEEGRLPVYQMGNNEHHAEVARLAREKPGVMTLHDLVLHHFLVEHSLKVQKWEPFYETLSADHGWVGEKAAMPRRWGGYGDAALFELPARRGLLRSQKGILVHSEWAQRELLEEQDDLRVAVIPMGIPLPDAVDSEVALGTRRRWGIPEEALLLGSFGFQTPIKRTEVVIQSLAEPGMEGVHLLVMGEESPGLGLDELVKDLGVESRVHRLGYVPFSDFEMGIAACDLCVNLRYPSAGETSASLLRVLAVGRPVIVSEYAQFADLSDSVVLKIPLGGRESQSLAQAVAQLGRQRSRLQAMGEASRAYVRKECSLVSAAESIAYHCRRWQEATILPESPVPPFIPTTLTWNSLKGEIFVDGLDSPWLEGERREFRVRVKNSGRATWLASHRGPGGVAAELEVITSSGSHTLPWVGLQKDLKPGAEWVFTQSLRRPLGPVELKIGLRILEGTFRQSPYWKEAV